MIATAYHHPKAPKPDPLYPSSEQRLPMAPFIKPAQRQHRELVLLAMANDIARRHGFNMREVWPRMYGIQYMQRSPRLLACRSETVYLLRRGPIEDHPEPSMPYLSRLLNGGKNHSSVCDWYRRGKRAAAGGVL
jgi:hypothetical protein